MAICIRYRRRLVVFSRSTRRLPRQRRRQRSADLGRSHRDFSAHRRHRQRRRPTPGWLRRPPPPPPPSRASAPANSVHSSSTFGRWTAAHRPMRSPMASLCPAASAPTRRRAVLVERSVDMRPDGQQPVALAALEEVIPHCHTLVSYKHCLDWPGAWNMLPPDIRCQRNFNCLKITCY